MFVEEQGYRSIDVVQPELRRSSWQRVKQIYAIGRFLGPACVSVEKHPEEQVERGHRFVVSPPKLGKKVLLAASVMGQISCYCSMLAKYLKIQIFPTVQLHWPYSDLISQLGGSEDQVGYQTVGLILIAYRVPAFA